MTQILRKLNNNFYSSIESLLLNNCKLLNFSTDRFPSITALAFENALTLGVGTATGQVLLYDLRSNKPFRVKDHLFGLPIRDIVFQDENVLSMDSSSVKIWNKDTVSTVNS